MQVVQVYWQRQAGELGDAQVLKSLVRLLVPDPLSQVSRKVEGDNWSQGARFSKPLVRVEFGGWKVPGSPDRSFKWSLEVGRRLLETRPIVGGKLRGLAGHLQRE